MSQLKFHLSLLLLAWLVALVRPGWVSAQDHGVRVDSTSIHVDTQDYPLEDALLELIDKTDIDLAYDPELLYWKRSGCLLEATGIEAALECILAGTGLTFRRTESGTYVIVKRESGDRSSFTVSGFVQDAASAEMTIGANVYEPALKLGTATNAYGFYSVTLPADTVTLVFSYLGYQTAERTMVLTADVKLDVTLEPATLSSEEIVVSAERTEQIQETTQMSTVSVPVRQVKSIPTIMGETDLIKAFQLMPGVRGGAEGASGLLVRGGSPDQTLILLDGAPVYNVSHFFGLFSVFNGEAVRNAQLIKGGFPARYGGRLSSVLDVGMKEGNMKEFGGEAAIGAIGLRVMVEGPIVKDKTSFLVSGRRTWLDQVARPFMNEDETATLYFYDLNAKINHKLTDRDRLYFSVYTGDDRIGVEEKDSQDRIDARIDWGNLTSTLRWNRVLNNKLFSNVTATFTDYAFNIAIDEEDFLDNNTFILRYVSGIRDWAGRVDFDYLPSPNHFVRIGGSATYHTFRPGASVVEVDDPNFDQGFDLVERDPINSWEFTAYAEDDFRVTDLLKINVGLHGSAYRVGSTTFTSLEPRVSARYLLPNGWGLKASYARMKQYILLLSNSSIGLPTDLWLPVTERVPPQTSQQVAAGISTSLLDNQFEFSIEGYYKEMANLIEYKNGAVFLGVDNDWQDNVESGDGRSFGVELLLQKKAGRTTGWIGYTLSKTERQFENLNAGEWFPFRYDATHDFALTIVHNWKPWLELSANWVYTTGNSITLPTTLYYGHPYVDTEGCFSCVAQSFPERGNYRQSPHHRLDVAVNFHKTTQRGRTQTISVGAYNAYNNKNPYFVYLSDDDRQLKQLTLFPIIPYITYRRAF